MRFLIPSLLISSISFPALAVDRNIEQLAPESTFAVMMVRDCSQAMEKIQRTGLWGLWTSEPMMAARKEFTKTFLDEAEKMFEELGIPSEDLVPPDGDLGMAFFTEMNDDLGIATLQMLCIADWGAGAEQTAGIIQKAIAHGEKNSGLRYEEKQIRNRKVLSFVLPTPDGAGADDEEFDDAMAMNPFEGIADFSHMHYVRDGERFLMSTSLVALEDALESLDGAVGKGVGDRSDYRSALSQIGEQDISIVLLTEPLQVLLGPVMMMADMVKPAVLTAFGDVKAYTFGTRFDGPVGMLEQSIGILSSGDRGELFKLVDTTSPIAPPPALVGPDTVSYSRFNFEFAGVLDAVKKINASVPEMYREEIEMQLETFGPMIEPALATLGPDIHYFSTLTRPITSQSEQLTIAIGCRKVDDLNNLLAGFAPQMGFEPRDFLGHTIYTSPDNASLGLGGGFLLIGDNAAVEQALRVSGGKDTPSIADDRLFQFGMNALGSRSVVGWGFNNTIANFELSRATYREMMEEFEMYFTPTGMDELNAENFMPVADKLMESLTPELMAEFFGPMVVDIQAVDSGMVVRMIQLAPPAAAPAR